MNELAMAFFELREHFTSERLGALATMIENNDPRLIQGAYNRWLDDLGCYGNCPISELVGRLSFYEVRLISPPTDRWNKFIPKWDTTDRAIAFNSVYQAIKRVFEERGERREWRAANWWDV